MNILDPRFHYTPAAATSVEETWRKFGWKPTSAAERAERQRRLLERLSEAPSESSSADLGTSNS